MTSFVEQDKWAAGHVRCLDCGYDEGIHSYYIPSLPVECPECQKMACWPKYDEYGRPLRFGKLDALLSRITRFFKHL